MLEQTHCMLGVTHAFLPLSRTIPFNICYPEKAAKLTEHESAASKWTLQSTIYCSKHRRVLQGWPQPRLQAGERVTEDTMADSINDVWMLGQP